jgi:hypothetical protein
LGGDLIEQMGFAGTEGSRDNGKFVIGALGGTDGVEDLGKQDLRHLEVPSCLRICDNAGARTTPGKETCRLEETKVRPSIISGVERMPVFGPICIKNRTR